jgi:hypothetical protein
LHRSRRVRFSWNLNGLTSSALGAIFKDSAKNSQERKCGESSPCLRALRAEHRGLVDTDGTPESPNGRILRKNHSASASKMCWIADQTKVRELATRPVS